MGVLGCLGVQRAIFPSGVRFSKEFLYWSSQVLGPQCGKHEMDLSGPHPGCCCGKNPMDDPPIFEERGLIETRAVRLWSLEFCPGHSSTQGELRGIQGLWSLVL